MAITIRSNIASLGGQRNLDRITGERSRLTEQLASGLRINRASDDAAGLAVSSVLSTNARIFTQSIRNVGDAVSLVNIHDGATQELSSVIIRARELATQSANGVYSNQQRKALDQEGQAIRKEFNRIVSSTKFNGVALFSDTNTPIRFQAGFTQDSAALYFSEQNLAVNSTNSGTFGAARTSAQAYATNPDNVVQGDFNNDGILDVVANLNTAGRLEVQLGDGSGTFRTSTTLAISSSVVTYVGDFNGDGNSDIMAIDSSNSRGTLFSGRGNGSFTGPSSLTLGVGGSINPQPNSVLSVGDVNNDGISDILVQGNSLMLQTGRKSGGFNAAQVIFAGGSPRGAFGDFNGDGRLDIYASSSNNMQVRLQNADGSFGATTVVTVGSIGSIGQAGDFNGDGKLDLSYRTTTSSVPIYFGDGAGNFAAGAVYDAGITPSEIRAEDLNGDGIDDLITGHYAGGTVGVSFGASDGTFSTRISYSAGGSGPFSLQLGDLNGDGAIDIFGGLQGSSRAFSLLGGTRGVSTLNEFSLETRSGALSAIKTLEAAQNNLSAARGRAGAVRNRLETAVNNLGTLRENYLAASSRITDADVAVTSAEVVRTGILQNVATSVLAQANLLPELALSLLRI